MDFNRNVYYFRKVIIYFAAAKKQLLRVCFDAFDFMRLHGGILVFALCGLQKFCVVF